MDDARRVEAAAEAIDSFGPVPGARRRAKRALARSDEAVGGVVARETADKLAEALEEIAEFEHINAADRAVNALGRRAREALAAYRRDAP